MKYNIPDNISNSGLVNIIAEIIEMDQDIYSEASNLFRYVPYRLISSFYAKELKGVKDNKKYRMIIEKADDKKAVYRFENDRIVINEKWFKYIKSNRVIIIGWLKLKLIKYLQNRNPNVPAIPFKLDFESNRNLQRARKYWDKIIGNYNVRGIYSDQLLVKSNFDIDHFIPWSFVLHDKIWNLTPAIKSFNYSKGDKLPDLNTYLDKFCNQQYEALEIAIKYNFSNKILEDYLEIDSSIDLSTIPSKVNFTESIKNTINPLYQIASNQGFSQWV